MMPTDIDPNTGSIPAWAGEPMTAALDALWARVHPRVGGGAFMHAETKVSHAGPSPRGRGSPPVSASAAPLVGSIPAWAGEPTLRARWIRCPRVHPRVGGGAVAADAGEIPKNGPSPRGRGSRVENRADAICSGSIPAWAGEPCNGLTL
ncbi:protein of unknown function [Rhodovastum atsumiense]|nr:protein of unknown function [Rhodovastum atsumiense]